MTDQTIANRQIARAAGTVMAAFLLSNITGLIRQILVSRAFGTGLEIDAFNVAARFPDLLFNLGAGGALASAFIPTYTGFLTKDDREGAWHLASSIANLVGIMMSVTCVLAFIFAPQVVQYGLYIMVRNLEPGKLVLTVALLRVMLLSPVIFGISGLIMGVLNANQSFLFPALASSMYWLGIIFGVIVLTPRYGIFGLAWGVNIGALLHLGIQVPGLIKLKGTYFTTLGLRAQAVREVARLMAPRLIGVAIIQFNFLLNTILASAQSGGSVTAIQVAWAVMTMPQVVIAQAIAIAAMPTFSAQVARGRKDEMRSSMGATLRGVIFLALPATLGLILLRKPVVALLFEHGNFNINSTDMVAWALLWYTAGLVGHSVVEVLARAFHSLHDTKTPVFIGAIAMSLNLVFSLGFSALFARIGWMPHGGLALANSLATVLEMIGLLLLIRRKLDGIEGKNILFGTLQAAVATLVMSFVLWIWLRLTGNQGTWLIVIGGIVIGGVVYLLTILILGVRESKGIVKVISQQVKKG